MLFCDQIFKGIKIKVLKKKLILKSKIDLKEIKQQRIYRVRQKTFFLKNA